MNTTLKKTNGFALTLTDLADLAIDQQRAQEARQALTREDDLVSLSASAIWEAKDAADDFVKLAHEIETLLQEKSVAENKEAWVMSTRQTIDKCQGRLRVAICHLVLCISNVREECGQLPMW